MLKIKKEVYEVILSHVKRSYPYECCGVLVGHIHQELKSAVDSRPIENLNRERAQDRFNMDPVGFLRVEKEIAPKGLEIVGIYHSHPDHPPMPSQTDFQFAWPVYSYVIVAIAQGDQIETRNWCLNDEASAFVEEAFEIGV